MTQRWQTQQLPDDDEGDTPKRHFPPSKAKLRMLAKASREGGRFTCPTCRESFTVTYGVYGKIGNFGESGYYCKDCVELAKDFRKEQK